MSNVVRLGQYMTPAWAALDLVERYFGTITTRDRWAVIDGDRMRMLDVDECRRAMGFPASYRLPQRAKDAMHMLGNAVCPPVARDIIHAVQAAA